MARSLPFQGRRATELLANALEGRWSSLAYPGSELSPPLGVGIFGYNLRRRTFFIAEIGGLFYEYIDETPGNERKPDTGRVRASRTVYGGCYRVTSSGQGQCEWSPPGYPLTQILYL